MRIGIKQINPTIGDFSANVEKILQGMEWARSKALDLVIFPELAVSGYPPDDFLLMPHFIEAGVAALDRIIAASKGVTAIFGTFRKSEKGLYNSAALIQDGRLLGYQDKSLLPTYDVFDERRYFEAGKSSKVWKIHGKRVAVTICEDIWQHTGGVELAKYCHDPIADLKNQAPELLINISASPFHMARLKERLGVCAGPAKTLGCPVILCNQVGGNDSLIFDGHSLAVNAQGELFAQAKGFVEDALVVDTDKMTPITPPKENAAKELYEALVLGIRDYFHKLGLKKACIGISGGIDSAVTACLAAKALGNKNVLGVIMPSRYSSEESFKDANQLIEHLGIEQWTFSIEEPFTAFLQLLEPKFKDLPTNTAEENLQARIRGMILMAVSNKFGHIVLSTGNKSELAMGYATLYGDTVGGLGVLNDVTKEQVYRIGHWINHENEIIPKRIFTKAPSAELRPNQKDSDFLPEYAIVDTVVKAYVEEHLSAEKIAKRHGYPLDLVKDLVRKIHFNEYKRRQSAPGLRVSKKAFAVGRRFPIVQKWVD